MARNIEHNLLSVRGLKALVRWRWFPVDLQMVILGILLFFVWASWGVGEGADEKTTDLLARTNLANVVVWGIWWPGLVIVTVLFGRIWCTVCPLELVHRGADWLARRMRIPRRAMPGWVRAGWLALGVYTLMHILVATAGLHHVPHLTAVMLLVLLALAVLAALLFREPRSFCTAFCPGAALLAVYSRFTRLQLDVVDTDVCARCKTRDCVDGRNRYRFDARSCPSLIRPFARVPGDACTLCFQCAKVCPYDNVGWGIVTSSSNLFKKPRLRPYEVAFVVMAMGFVVHEMVEEVGWAEEIFMYVPDALASVVPIPHGWLDALWYLALFPLVFWPVALALSWLVGWRGTVWRAVAAGATGAAPVVALAHLAKGVYKIAESGPYLLEALRDPRGRSTAAALLASGRALAPWFGVTVLGVLLLAALLWLAARAWRWSLDVGTDDVLPARVGMLLSALLYGAVAMAWCIG